MTDKFICVNAILTIMQLVYVL